MSRARHHEHVVFLASVVAACLGVASWAAPVSAQAFRYPSTCGPGCVGRITYYDEGGRDWACGSRYYGGHRGTDWAMGLGQPIVAAAPGTVSRARDGCWDRCTTGDCTCTNLVGIAHPSGMTTEYLHMMRGSVRVGAGAPVSCGTLIGQVASSGQSYGFHLHFHYWMPGGSYSSRLDPFAGPCSPYPSRFFDQGPYLGVPSDRCFVDADGDGSPAGEDCDDGNPQRRPGRAEACDGQENDCDAAVDEALSQPCGTDVGECRTGIETCTLGTWGACVGSIGPADERCDLLDNDCNGIEDDDRICEHDDATLGAMLGDRASSDVDGDGMIDACMRTPDGFECLLGEQDGFTRRVRGPAMDGSDWDAPAASGSIRMADVDGDGRDDVCARAGDRVRCWRAAPEGFGESIVSLPIDAAMDRRSAQLWLADVDGDGRVDPCIRAAEGLRCEASTDHAARALSALSDERGWGDVGRHGTIRFGDLNGDGRDDVCARDEEGVRCWLADAVGFSTQVLGPPWSDAAGWGEARYRSTIRMSDVNGDGRADLCGRGPEGFVCALGSSEGAASAPLLRGPSMDGASWDARASYATIRLGDVDGDGTSDVCARIDERLSCWLGSATGFSERVLGPALLDTEGWSDPVQYTSLRLADVTGDGLADVCGRDAEGIRCWVADGSGFPTALRTSAWRDEDGVGDGRYVTSLTIAGASAGSLQASCGCRAGARSASGGVLVGLTAIALAIAQRRSRGKKIVSGTSGSRR
jgi:hypothetical protein